MVPENTGNKGGLVAVRHSSKEETMQIHELGHVVLFVKSLQRSAHFYRDVLGFRALETPERMRVQVMAFSTAATAPAPGSTTSG